MTSEVGGPHQAELDRILGPTWPPTSSSARASRSRPGRHDHAGQGRDAVDGPAARPSDLDVPWNIGSATKTFVAVVVLQLAEEGRLDLDAGIDRFLPELPGAERITPRQLLQHTSGLGEYKDQPAVLNDPTRAWTRPS